ncbi:Wd repeat protein [Thalictrum thalictroides]|uniref:Wd repeat protein n=1 Tax=Thalictrum thalictroides TaxID=46969 RepID=A0A7J6USD9_THATH|nr:Wd repeat protein [Thalictrum thalictroides]
MSQQISGANLQLPVSMHCIHTGREIFGMGVKNYDVKTTDASSHEKKTKKKKRAASSDLETHENAIEMEALQGLDVEDDPNEPTMGEKLASLNLLDDRKAPKHEISSPRTKPPSADSVHVLLKQALRADDRVLLMNCLHTQDGKVIENSISLLSPSDVLKLLDSLIPIVQSRGAVLVCALPWLKSLLLQHASSIMSQESSILALNSLYQLIESRVSTFQPALQLSSSLDYLFVGMYDDMDDDTSIIPPTIYEDKDESDEDEPDDASETDQESDGPPLLNDFSDLDASDVMSE